MNQLLPRYVRILREDAHPDVRPSYMHLGHWSEPDVRPLAYGVYEAQQTLAEIVIDMAVVRDGGTILDAGCGFGGICQLIDDRFSSVQVIGVDIDATQLDVCAGLTPRAGNRFSWVYGDATSMPFVGQTVDAVISVEAAMHFPSRKKFFEEVARLLRPHGRLVMVDILLDVEAAERRGLSVPVIERTLAPEFTPWPEFDTQLDDVLKYASEHGLRCIQATNASVNTLPTYLPDAYVEFPPGMMRLGSQDSVELFVELHRTGVLNVHYLVFSNDMLAAIDEE